MPPFVAELAPKIQHTMVFQVASGRIVHHVVDDEVAGRRRARCSTTESPSIFANDGLPLVALSQR
jgi:hypothetical protein